MVTRAVSRATLAGAPAQRPFIVPQRVVLLHPETLTAAEADILERLERRLHSGQTATGRLNDYYEGDHLLEQLGLAIPPELQSFSVVLNWPRVTVDAIEERLDVTGFRLPGRAADTYLWEVWQYNDLDEQQSAAHVEALALSRSFLCVGTNPDDPEHPLVTVESPSELVTMRDPATRRVTAALRLYGDGVTEVAAETKPQGSPDGTRATLYLPNVTHWLVREGGQWRADRDPDRHGLGVVAVVPMLNRDRPTRRRSHTLDGVSEMNDVIPLAESASRAVTNAQLAQETHAVPHRVLLGAAKSDFVRGDGSPVGGAFEVYMSSLTAIANPAGKAVQFDASDLANFETVVNLYARAASGVTGLPIEYFGLNTQNAPSAEGQRAGETRLIKRAERRQVAFGHAWEQAMRLVLRFGGRPNADDPTMRGLEATWQDAGTPTQAQVTDAVAKQYAAGLVDWETAQELLGRTPAQIAVMKTRRNADLGQTVGAAVDLALANDAGGVDPATLDAAALPAGGAA